MPRDTFTVNVPRTFRKGWGVSVVPIWDEGECITEVYVDVVHITRRAVKMCGGTPCVETEVGLVPAENFADVADLTQDDSHDLRDRWFATKEEAEDHAEGVRGSWDHPNPWQSFVVLS